MADELKSYNGYDAQGGKLVNLGTPTNPTDGATKAYVDAGSTIVRVYLVDSTWNKLAGLKAVRTIVIGAGGTGASGRRGAAGSIRGGGGGGGGGIIHEKYIDAALLSSSEPIQVGQIVAGGAARTADNTSGATGTQGTSSFFGATAGVRVIARGGFPGAAGTTALGAGGAAAINGGATGGAGSAGAAAGGAAGSGSLSSAAGGGGGAGLDAANAGGAGGAGGTNVLLNGSSTTVAPGTTPLGAVTGAAMGGQGGPGGASDGSTSVDGTDGAQYGAGGGGGAASVNGVNSGKGGSNGPGIVIVIEFY